MGVSIDISSFAVWSVLAIIIGAIIGNVVHIVKKESELEKTDEQTAFQKWVIGRPFTTIGAVAAGVMAAWGVAPPIAETGTLPDLVRSFFQSLAMGVAADSFINRPKNGNGNGAKKDPDSM